jgi:hypothetical protein
VDFSIPLFFVYTFVLVCGFVGLLYFLFRPKDKWSRRSTTHDELMRVLLGLDDDSLAQLMKLYKQQFGDGPARYAKHTYEKWKNGKVKPNKQTFNRFLINLPKVMSFDMKCEVLRKLREAYCARDQYKLTVYTDDWKQKLTPLVDNLITRTDDTELPQQLQQRLSWLSEDDTQIANKLLQRSQREQSLHALTLLDEEFRNIDGMLATTGNRSKVMHTIKLPYGNIILNIKRR